MRTISRRSALRFGIAAPLAAQVTPRDLKALGKTPVRASAAIASSPLSVGFECLDRRLFDPDRTYAHVAQLGVKWARVQTGWSRCERVRGEFDFRWLDEIVDSLLRIGVHPWFNLGYGNKLYTPDAPLESAVGWVPLRTAEAREAWVRFTSRAAQHFRGRVRHWEIWNEPNIKTFWKPEEPSADGYAALVTLTAPEIRKVIPDAVIVGGVITSLPYSLDYLERALDLGMAEHVDRLSYHPYRTNPDANYDTDVRALRALLARYKPGLALWQGECGMPSAKGSWSSTGLEWNEVRQAKWLMRRTLGDLAMEIELSSYFHIADLLNYSNHMEGAPAQGQSVLSGLLRAPEYTPKPSYYAYQCLCAIFDSETKRADFAVNFTMTSPRQSWVPEAVRSAAFERRGYPLYAYWYPSDPMTEFAPGRVLGVFWSGATARLSEPVLIDPLNQTVLRPERAERKGGSWKVWMPLADYPLILTDKAATL